MPHIILRLGLTATLAVTAALALVTVPRPALAQGVATHSGTFALHLQGDGIYQNLNSADEVVMLTLCINPGPSGGSLDWGVIGGTGDCCWLGTVPWGKCITSSYVVVPVGWSIILDASFAVTGTYSVSKWLAPVSTGN